MENDNKKLIKNYMNDYYSKTHWSSIDIKEGAFQFFNQSLNSKYNKSLKLKGAGANFDSNQTRVNYSNIFNAYQFLLEKYREIEIDENKFQSNITSGNIEIAHETINDIFNDPNIEKNIGKNIKDKFDSFKDNKPLQYIFLKILFWIFMTMIAVPIIENIGSKIINTVDANIKESIDSTTKSLIRIPIGTEMTIIDNEPYWYKIVYTNSDTNEVEEGYIAKKNVKIIKD